jgi:hypothetical protein
MDLNRVAIGVKGVESGPNSLKSFNGSTNRSKWFENLNGRKNGVDGLVWFEGFRMAWNGRAGLPGMA